MNTQETARNAGNAVISAALYAAATLQVLIARGASYYAENEDAILEGLSELAATLNAGIRKAYALTRSAAIGTYKAGQDARAAYDLYGPVVADRALELRIQATELVDAAKARFAR